jgi:hypothetical protein
MRTTDGQVPMPHWRSRRPATATPPPTLSSGAFPIDRRPVVAQEFLLFNPLSRDLSISSSLLLLVTYVTYLPFLSRLTQLISDVRDSLVQKGVLIGESGHFPCPR